MNKKNSFLHIGFSSILMVFITICLVTFAALSLLTANADLRLSKKTADNTKAYYNACNTAEALLSEIDHNLTDLYQSSLNKEDYMQLLGYFFSDTSAFWDLSIVDNHSYDTDSRTLFFSVQMTTNQNLEVELTIYYPTHEQPKCYYINRYQTKTYPPEASTEVETLPIYTK